MPIGAGPGADEVFDAEGPFADPRLGVRALHRVHARRTPAHSGRIPVPVLWDRVAGRIVSNESADILRILAALGQGPDLRPDRLAAGVDRWNGLIYPGLNNSAYRAGFVRAGGHDTAVADVFATPDRIEDRLSQTDLLCGGTFAEADLRLFPTLARFAVAYRYAFNATSGRSRITRIRGATPGGSMQCTGSRARWISGTTSRATARNRRTGTRWGSCRRVPFWTGRSGCELSTGCPFDPDRVGWRYQASTLFGGFE